MRYLRHGVPLSLLCGLLAAFGSMSVGCDLLSDSSKESSTGNDVVAMKVDFTAGVIQEGLSMGVARARGVRGTEVFSSL